MKLHKKLILILIVILLAVGIISLASTFLFTPEIKEFDMHLIVGDYIGLNTDTDAIYFGTVSPSGSGSRKIILENDDDFSEEVKISASGELAEWIWIEENNFILNKGETREIKIHVSPPEDAEYRDYTGRLRISSKKIYFSAD